MRPCPVAGTQQPWNSRGLSTHPLMASAPLALHHWSGLSPRENQALPSPIGSSNGAEIRIWQSYSPSFSILNSWALMGLWGLSCLLKSPHMESMVGTTGSPLGKNLSLEFQVMADIRINSRWLKDLNVKHETTKIVKEENRWIFIILEGRGSTEDHSKFNTKGR